MMVEASMFRLTIACSRLPLSLCYPSLKYKQVTVALDLLGFVVVFYCGIELGIENCGISLVLVLTTRL